MIFFLNLGQCSRDVIKKLQQNHLCHFERGYHGEYSCEVIWNLDQWFKRRCLKTFLI